MISRKLSLLIINCIKYLPFNSVMKLRNFLYKFALNEMGVNCNICDGVTISRPQNIYLGNRVSIHEYTLIGGSGDIKIGNYVAIGSNCSIISENHNFNDKQIKIKDQGVTPQPIVIGENVWLGCKVIILGNVTIGHGAVIGAGSVVTRSVPENAIVVGNPARVIRQR